MEFTEVMQSEQHQKSATIRDALWKAQHEMVPAFHAVEIGSADHVALLDVLNRLVKLRVKHEDACLRMAGM